MNVKSYEKEMSVTIYETSDGQTFHFEHQAEYHEKALWSSRIRQDLVGMIVEHPFENMLSRHWTMMRNKDELEYFIDKLGSEYYINDRYYLNDRDVGAKNSISVGDWIAECYDDDGDEEGFWTLSFLHSKMKEVVEEIEEKTVDGKF